MLSVNHIHAETRALHGDCVIAGATADEISNSVSSGGMRHAKTAHRHVAVVTGSKNGKAIGYSKALGGTPWPDWRFSDQWLLEIRPLLNRYGNSDPS